MFLRAPVTSHADPQGGFPAGRWMVLALLSLMLAAAALRLAPLIDYSVWGSDWGEYHALTQQLVETGHHASESLGWGKAYVDFALEQRAFYEVLYAPVEVIGVHRDEGVVADQACAINQFWSDRVREMIDAGYLRDGDPHAISVTLWGLGHGLISIYHRGLLPAETEDEFRNLVTESYFRMMVGIGTERYAEVMDEVRSLEDQR